MAKTKEARVYSFTFRNHDSEPWIYIANATRLGSFLGDGVLCSFEEKGKAVRAIGWQLSKQASEASAYWKRLYGYEKMRVVPLPANAVIVAGGANAAEYFQTLSNWTAREQAKFDSGAYIPLPWADEYWFKDKHAKLKHFAHVSKKDPKKIAYTESAEKGILNRQTPINPGSYLSKYFDYELDSEAIARAVVKYAELYGEEERELKFAETEDAVRWVYENGPNSCMGHETSAYSSYYNGKKYHPTSVYASPDVAVAYMLDPDNAERVTARAVISKKNKRYARIYGDAQRFEKLLRKAGFSHSDRALQDCRILRRDMDIKAAGRRASKDQIGYILPYFDSDGQRVKDIGDKEFLIVGNANTNELGICAGSTDGTVWIHDGKRGCFACGTRARPDDLVWRNIASHGDYVCDSCYQQHGWTCSHCDSPNYGNEYRFDVYLVTGKAEDKECICNQCSRNQTAECVIDGRRYYRTKMKNLAGSTRNGGPWVHESYYDTHTFECRVLPKARMLNKDAAGYVYGKPVSPDGYKALLDPESEFMAGLSDLRREDISLSLISAAEMEYTRQNQMSLDL